MQGLSKAWAFVPVRLGGSEEIAFRGPFPPIDPLLLRFIDPLLPRFVDPLLLRFIDPLLLRFVDPLLLRFIDPLLLRFIDPLLLRLWGRAAPWVGSGRRSTSSWAHAHTCEGRRAR